MTTHGSGTGADPDGFERAVAPLRAELRVHCYRMLGSVHDAEDAVQESLLRAWRGMATFEDRGVPLRAWLYKIATNRCLSMIETRRRRELPMDLTPGAAPPAETAWLEPYPDARVPSVPTGPEARYEAHEAMRLAFVAVLQHLPGRQRAALLLRDVLGMSARETAGLLDVSVPAVNSLLQRARATMETKPSRSTGSAADVRRLAEAYTDAWERGDPEAIMALFTADARYAMPPLPEWYQGHDDIRAFLLRGPLTLRWRFLPAQANGQLTFGTYAWDDARQAYLPAGLDVLDVRDGAISEVVSFLTPGVFEPFDLPASLP